MWSLTGGSTVIQIQTNGPFHRNSRLRSFKFMKNVTLRVPDDFFFLPNS